MLFDIGFLDAFFDTGGSIDFHKDFSKLDLNGDGILDIHDCPYEFGSPKAKLWWHEVMVPCAKTQVTNEMVADYGEAVKGAYKGKALVPGVAGKGQGDFNFLVDRLQVTRGYGYGQAAKIAGKIKSSLYGG